MGLTGSELVPNFLLCLIFPQWAPISSETQSFRHCLSDTVSHHRQEGCGRCCPVGGVREETDYGCHEQGSPDHSGTSGWDVVDSAEAKDLAHAWSVPELLVS